MARQQEVDKAANHLNAQDHVVYEEVMDIKSKYYKWAFDEQKDAFLKSKDFRIFYVENKHWLEPYAVFSYLRDKHGTPDFTRWGNYAVYDADKMSKLVDPGHKEFEHVAIHFFIQYHLDKQLTEATNYGREQGVVLKGDIPIGIYRNSVDAWMYPHLFNMESQAGAPPDDFSISGQNWGFPTYNWDEMSKDGFQWWKARLQKMSDYFDVFRIDHILGFFRIWEIPSHGVEGTMGYFNPSLPFSTQEVYNWGIHFDIERLCRPYIREHMLPIIFAEHDGLVRQEYLAEYAPGHYRLKAAWDTQLKVKEHFAKLINSDPEKTGYYEFIRRGLYQLIGEVLFFEAPFTNGEGWNPRVGMQNTFSFRELDDHTRNNIDKLYIHYFYKRHNDFWRDKAMEKLPALKSATDMLICGEDLGMVPDSVPGVMKELSILSLAVQRMPNDSSMEFWHPGDTLYLSVCSTSSHDTSTLRGWWEEDRAKTQRFYNNILGDWGDAPAFCEPWVATQVINQHLYSPSMWSIFPIQDLLAMDGKLRRENPDDERINVPANPQHYWKYRMHLTLEQLLKEDGFNGFIRQLNDQSGRNAPF
jgi:4-alpha-glucanotransferase